MNEDIAEIKIYKRIRFIFIEILYLLRKYYNLNIFLLWMRKEEHLKFYEMTFLFDKMRIDLHIWWKLYIFYCWITYFFINKYLIIFLSLRECTNSSSKLR